MKSRYEIRAAEWDEIAPGRPSYSRRGNRATKLERAERELATARDWTPQLTWFIYDRQTKTRLEK